MHSILKGQFTTMSKAKVVVSIAAVQPAANKFTLTTAIHFFPTDNILPAFSQ